MSNRSALDELNAELDRTAVISEAFKDRIGVLTIRAMEESSRAAEERLAQTRGTESLPEPEGGLWVKLHRKNNWGAETYRFGKDGPQLEGDRVILIRWPDGFMQKVEVQMKTYHTEVADHGHSYAVSGTRPYLWLPHHGTHLVLPLNSVEVEIWTEDSKE